MCNFPPSCCLHSYQLIKIFAQIRNIQERRLNDANLSLQVLTAEETHSQGVNKVQGHEGAGYSGK